MGSFAVLWSLLAQHLRMCFEHSATAQPRNLMGTVPSVLDAMPFQGRGENQEWLLETPPATALADANSTMSHGEREFKMGNDHAGC